jgi:hypothetical protein
LRARHLVVRLVSLSRCHGGDSRVSDGAPASHAHRCDREIEAGRRRWVKENDHRERYAGHRHQGPGGAVDPELLGGQQCGKRCHRHEVHRHQNYECDEQHPATAEAAQSVVRAGSELAKRTSVAWLSQQETHR